jgi:ribonuclease HII
MDSKQLTRAAREKVYPKLIEEVTFYYVQIEPQEIDSLGVGAALRQGHMLATLAAIRSHQEKGHTDTPCCIVDGTKPVPMPPGYPVILTLPKADALIPAVSAASIIAKVRHDWEMDELDRKYPGYSLSKGAGYGTAAHQEGLKKLGCSPAHRMSYAPMKDMLKNAESDIFAGMEE